MANELVVKRDANDLVDQWIGPGQAEEQADALFDSGLDSRGRPKKPVVELSAVQKKLRRKIEESKNSAIPRKQAKRAGEDDSDEEDREDSRAGAIQKKLERKKDEKMKKIGGGEGGEKPIPAAAATTTNTTTAASNVAENNSSKHQPNRDPNEIAIQGQVKAPLSRSQIRKLTGRKTRSRQKNIKKDHRPPEKKPGFFGDVV